MEVYIFFFSGLAIFYLIYQILAKMLYICVYIWRSLVILESWGL